LCAELEYVKFSYTWPIRGALPRVEQVPGCAQYARRLATQWHPQVTGTALAFILCDGRERYHHRVIFETPARNNREST
jgi:hypothetical protein